MAARILVVEDNRDNMTLMAYLLGAFGYEPLLAPGGGDGIRLAVKERPDIILMDIQMPEMDGYETTTAIRSQIESAIPIVAVTAFAMVGDRDLIMTSGFDGYITKPIKPETFVAEVEAFLPDALRSSHARSA
jgi:CheY-like chemotaxis protein